MPVILVRVARNSIVIRSLRRLTVSATHLKTEGLTTFACRIGTRKPEVKNACSERRKNKEDKAQQRAQNEHQP